MMLNFLFSEVEQEKVDSDKTHQRRQLSEIFHLINVGEVRIYLSLIGVWEATLQVREIIYSCI